MSFRAKKALGIDISDGWINLVLLEKSKNGIKLLKTAAAPVPDGAIKNGNIEDAAALAKAIKTLKARNQIHSRHTAISLIANPTLLQILDMHTGIPHNVRRLVQNVVKHYAVLPIQNTAIDFCGIKSSAKLGHRRALIVATDSHKVTATARTFRKEGLVVDAIEPASMAYIRACYEKRISQKFGTNLLFAIVHNDTVTFCVFRDQTLDFVRTKQLEADNHEPQKCVEWLAEEINAIIKFYELNIHDKYDKWELTLLTNIRDGSLSREIESLENGLELTGLEIRTLEDAYLDTPIANEEHNNKPSAVAVGLAMKFLNIPGCGLNINLFPPDVDRAKSREKRILVNANIAAIIFILMVLSIGFFNMNVNRVDANIGHKTPGQVSSNTRALLDEKKLLHRQTTDISDKLNRLNTTLNTGSFLRWNQILDEIKLVIPTMVRVIKLSSKDNSQILIEGEAASYENVHCFVDMLNNCKHIQSASLITIGKESSSDILLSYSISCSLIQQKDK